MSRFAVLTLLSVFPDRIVGDVIDAILRGGSGLKADFNRFRASNKGLPVLLKGLGAPGIAESDEDTHDYVTGMNVMIMAIEREPKGRSFWRTALQSVFGLSTDVADRIARDVETPDYGDSFWEDIKSGGAWVANFILPTSWEFDKAQFADHDLFIEIAGLGAATKKILRDMRGVKFFNEVLLEPLRRLHGAVDTLQGAAETGDPIAVGDVIAHESPRSIADLQRLERASDAANAMLAGGEVGGLFSSVLEGLGKIGSTIGKAVTGAVNFIPPEVLSAAAQLAAGKLLGGNSPQAPAPAPRPAPAPPRPQPVARPQALPTPAQVAVVPTAQTFTPAVGAQGPVGAAGGYGPGYDVPSVTKPADDLPVFKSGSGIPAPRASSEMSRGVTIGNVIAVPVRDRSSRLSANEVLI